MIRAHIVPNAQPCDQHAILCDVRTHCPNPVISIPVLCDAHIVPNAQPCDQHAILCDVCTHCPNPVISMPILCDVGIHCPKMPKHCQRTCRHCPRACSRGPPAAACHSRQTARGTGACECRGQGSARGSGIQPSPSVHRGQSSPSAGCPVPCRSSTCCTQHTGLYLPAI